ncbi:MAG: hypothetical protein AAFY88_09565 [Acidobacteriota bacterium]
MRKIDRLEELELWLDSAEEDDAPPIAVQDLDLRRLGPRIMARRWRGCLFLGCELELEQGGYIVADGGVVVPDLEGMLFPAHRSSLYTAEELFAGFDADDPAAFERTWDYRVYRQYLEHGKDRPTSIRVSLARRLHDHSITDAVMDLIEGRRVVAIMGGHGMERSDSFYVRVARIARQLTRDGVLMLSGGGPGAMEATHLGAWLATYPDGALDEALEILTPRPPGAAPGTEYADADWLHRAMRVIEAFPLDDERRRRSMSLGIPTWLYGHEPPAPFATHIAKYFANSVREDGLLALALDGVVFAPGSAGTTQEIFQDATQNHYGTPGFLSPMILFGVDHWTRVRPVWPLLEAVARDRRYGQLLALTDHEDEILERLTSYRREEWVAD